MADTGSPYNLRYPLSGDSVAVHTDLLNLATDTVTALNLKLDKSGGSISAPSISSPNLTGTVSVPTPAPTSNTGVAASTAFVANRFATVNGAENTDFNSAVTPPGIYPGLLHGVNNANGPGGGYWHVLNIEYGGTAGTRNLSQLALSYSTNSTETLALRTRYSGSWTPWYHLATKNYSDSTFATISSLGSTNSTVATKMPLAGGTFSGSVTFSSYAYFNYPAHFNNYATTHNAGINTTTLSASSTVSGSQGHFGSTSDRGIWTNYIHSSAWGDIIMETNGGGLVVKNNVGTLTPIACADPSSSDHAATKYYVDAVIYTHVLNYHSSRSLKSNIKDLDKQNTSSFASLKPKSFTFNPTGETKFGFIAEEVEEAGIPVYDHTKPKEKESDKTEVYKTLNPLDLVAVLWAKVQEQEERLAALEKK